MCGRAGPTIKAMTAEPEPHPDPPEGGSPAAARRAVVIRWCWLAASVALSQAIGIAFALAFARATYPIGPVDVTISAHPAWRGATCVSLPPLGRVCAATHRLPLEVDLLPAQLRMQSINDLLKSLDRRSETLARVRQDARRALQSYLWRLAVLALAGGALGSLVVGRRRPRQVLAAAGACLGLTTALAAGVGLGYRPHAFDNPEYSGVLSEAPVAIEMVRRGFSDFSRVRAQLRNTAANLGRTYAELASAPDRPNDASLRLLHVSDLHNNPAGLDLVASMAASYRVEAVLCTGDLTDYGSPLENRFFTTWRAIAVPKIFVSGNHDSQATMRAVQKLPNATVLRDGELVERVGLQIVGWNDPVSLRPGIGDAEVSEAELAALRERMETRLRAVLLRPDLVMVHNYRAAEACAGLAPVFLYGHDHRARIEQRQGSWLIDAGTTGAAGIRFVTGANRPPFSAAVLYLSRPPTTRLLAVDVIQLREPTGDFTVQRMTAPAPPPVPGPVPAPPPR
jgi:predicted phosphodiesterase